MLLVFILVICAACTLTVLLGSAKPVPAALIFMHSTIRETYRLSTDDQQDPDAAKKANIRKIIITAAIAVVYVVLAVIAAPKNFLGGFSASMVMWIVCALYVVLGLQCGLIGHLKAFRIRSSDNFDAQYKDYDDYLNNLDKILIAGVVLSIVSGLLCLAIGK